MSNNNIRKGLSLGINIGILIKFSSSLQIVTKIKVKKIRKNAARPQINGKLWFYKIPTKDKIYLFFYIIIITER